MSKTVHANTLFQSAVEDGVLSPQSSQILNVHDIGTDIQDALGVPAMDVTASEVVLVGMMPDDSGSMGSVEQEACDGCNLIIDAAIEAKSDGVLMHNRYLNGTILYPFTPLDGVIRMDLNNYAAIHGTPLYDETLVLLGTMIAKAQEFSDQGVLARTITCIITDGEDMHSRATARDVRSLVDDMREEESHIIAAMGIGSNKSHFKQIFQEMGIDDKLILTPDKTKSEIRKAFHFISQSVATASKSAAGFTKVAAGGFAQSKTA